MPKVNARYVDAPLTGSYGFGDEVPLIYKVLSIFGRGGSEDAVRLGIIPLRVPLFCDVPDDRGAFTESLILAQDERWRRA